MAAAASDVGFTLMGLSRFIWGGAVAGRADTLRAIYRGASRALSDDMYATRAAKRLGIPIRFLYLRLVGPAPAETPRGVFKRLVRQFAIASRQGPLLVKVGVALLAGWLALWAAYPYMFLVSALAGYLRRLALRAPCPPVYPAAMLAPLFTLAGGLQLSHQRGRVERRQVQALKQCTHLHRDDHNLPKHHAGLCENETHLGSGAGLPRNR